MAKSLAILLFGVLLFLQCLYAFPESKSDSSSSEENSVKTPKTKQSSEESSSEESSFIDYGKYPDLMKIALNESYHIANITLELGKNVFTSVLNDLNVLDKTHMSKNMSVYLEEIRNFVEKVSSENRTPLANIALVSTLTELREKFNTTKLAKPDAEILLIEFSMKKHGIEEIKTKADEDFIKFSEQFNVKVQQHFDALTEAEQKKPDEVKLMEWLQKFKTATDVDTKRTLFVNFFDFDGEESEIEKIAKNVGKTQNERKS